MKIGIIASEKNQKSLDLLELILKQYPIIITIKTQNEIENCMCDVIIVLGGDGFTLRILHKIIRYKKDIALYGINCGNVGFLLNNFDPTQDLIEKIKKSIYAHLHPLLVELHDRHNEIHEIYAINEISLIRQTHQAVNIKISINNEIKIASLTGDGVLLSTTAGSAAYNYSAGGMILPLESQLVALTAINSFRPRGWHSAILTDDCLVEFEIMDYKQRSALACADFQQFYFIKYIKARVIKNVSYQLLFDKESHLSNKIMREQFPQ